MLIYKVKNLINNKVFIGSSIRWTTIEEIQKEHYKEISNKTSNYYNIYLHNSIRTHSKKNFNWKVLHDNFGSLEALNATEIVTIDYFQAYYNGLNLTKGGDRIAKDYPKIKNFCGNKDNGWSGRKHSKKSKLKMSLIKSALSYATIMSIFDLAQANTTQKRISEIYNIPQSTISDVLTGKTYSHFTDKVYKKNGN